MGTKLGLHSADFLHALVHPQLLLSVSCTIALAAVSGLVLFADMANIHAARAPWWWATATGAIAIPIVLGTWYAHRAGDDEDETLGLVDVSTLPPSVTAPVLDDAIRGD
jgi:hypothetical protein